MICFGRVGLLALLKMIKNLSVFISLAVAASGAMAYNAAEFPTSSSGALTTFGTGTVGAGSLGPGTLSVASDGTILAKGPVSFTGSGGLKVEAQLASRISKPAIALAFGRFFAKALPIVVVAGGLYDLAKDLGFIPQSSPGGVGVDFMRDAPLYLWAGDGVNFSTNQAGECAKSAQSLNTPNYSYSGTSGPNFYNCSMNEHKISAPSTDTPFTYGIAYKSNPSGGGSPATRQEFLDAVAARSGWPSTAALAPALEQAIASGESVAATPEVLSGPATVPGTKTKTVTSTGSTTTTNITNNTYYGPTVTTTTTTTIQNYAPDGSTIGPPIVNTTDAAPAPADPASSAPLKVCGLTTDTACKIDELDTPKPDPLVDGKKITDDITKPLKDFAADPQKALPTLPQLNWAFTLPSGCVPISIPAFEPFLQTIDICQFQPMFHDVMSMVWVMGALFGAISMFWRNTLSQN